MKSPFMLATAESHRRAWSFAASSLINSRLYGVASQDLLTLALATGLLLLVAISAAYLLAQRASRVDPMTALRHE